MTNARLDSDEDRLASEILYILLLNSCRGAALPLVVNAGETEGLVAWQKLNHAYDPKTMIHLAVQLQQLLAW